LSTPSPSVPPMAARRLTTEAMNGTELFKTLIPVRATLP
jgi:hypothetical protein